MVYLNIEKICLEKDGRTQRKVGAAPSQVYFQECSAGVYVKMWNHLRCWYAFFQDEIKPLCSQFSLGKKINQLPEEQLGSTQEMRNKRRWSHLKDVMMLESQNSQFPSAYFTIKKNVILFKGAFGDKIKHTIIVSGSLAQ